MLDAEGVRSYMDQNKMQGGSEHRVAHVIDACTECLASFFQHEFSIACDDSQSISVPFSQHSFLLAMK